MFWDSLLFLPLPNCPILVCSMVPVPVSYFQNYTVKIITDYFWKHYRIDWSIKANLLLTDNNITSNIEVFFLSHGWNACNFNTDQNIKVSVCWFNEK